MLRPIHSVPIRIRLAKEADIPALAKLRSVEWGTELYWTSRISAYLSGQLSPRQALRPRAAFVATERKEIVGFTAGHLTCRYDCDAELEWINVIPSHRHRGVARLLLAAMAAWFVDRHAHRVCVDVAPRNSAARAFYSKHGAVPLNPHWMVWNDITALASR